MRPEMVEVFALQVDLRAAELGAEVAAMEYRRGAATVMGEKLGQFGIEIRVVLIFKEGLCQLVEYLFEAFVYKLTTVGTKITSMQRLLKSLAGFGHTHKKLLLRRTTLVTS